MVRVLRAVAPTWYWQVARGTEPAEPQPPAAVQACSQERFQREIAAFLQEATRLHPLVVFLDDVHWADVSTVDLLAYLAIRCAVARLLLVLAYRPTELLLSQHPLRQLLLDLQARSVCRELPLSFLSREDVVSYLTQAFPGHHFPPEFAA